MQELLPHDFYSNLQLGRLLGKVGQPAEGEAFLQQAARQRSSIPEVWTELGKVQMDQRKDTAALDSYTRAIKLRPQDAGYLCRQANALTELNRRAEAIATYRRAIQIRPEMSDAHFELAGVLAHDNQVTESAREYAEAIRLNPRHAASRINFGVMLFRQNRLDEAIQQFKAALQIEPQNRAAADYLRQVSAQRNLK